MNDIGTHVNSYFDWRSGTTCLCEDLKDRKWIASRAARLPLAIGPATVPV